MFDLFGRKPRRTLPAIVKPAPVPAARPSALMPYTPPRGEILPPERYAPPARCEVQVPIEQIEPERASSFWSLFERKPKPQLKVSYEFRSWGSRRIIFAIFKNQSKYIYPGGTFEFRIKEGQKVVASSSHRGRDNGCVIVESKGFTPEDSYESWVSGGYEATYTVIGSLNPGEYEEVKLPGFYDRQTRQKVIITL